MASVRRVTIQFACGDDFTTAISPRARLEVIEGTFNVQGAAATLAVGEGTPSASGMTAGAQFPAGSYISTGPTITIGSGWRLDHTYWRNQSIGQNATVVFIGTVRDVFGA